MLRSPRSLVAPEHARNGRCGFLAAPGHSPGYRFSAQHAAGLGREALHVFFDFLVDQGLIELAQLGRRFIDFLDGLVCTGGFGSSARSGTVARPPGTASLAEQPIVGRTGTYRHVVRHTHVFLSEQVAVFLEIGTLERGVRAFVAIKAAGDFDDPIGRRGPRVDDRFVEHDTTARGGFTVGFRNDAIAIDFNALTRFAGHGHPGRQNPTRPRQTGNNGADRRTPDPDSRFSAHPVNDGKPRKYFSSNLRNIRHSGPRQRQT